MYKQSSLQTSVMIAGDLSAMMKEMIGILEEADGMRIVAIASSGKEAIGAFARHRPDLSLVDLPLLAQDDFAPMTTMRVLRPDARVVALTDHGWDARIGAAMRAGATAHACKNMLAEELVRMACGTGQGPAPLARTGGTNLAGQHAADRLSPRELDVLRLASIGNSNRAIANILGIGEGTVKTHMGAAFSKLGACDRTHAVVLAIKRGYVLLD